MTISLDTIFLSALIALFGILGALLIVIRDTSKIPDISIRLIRTEHVLNQLMFNMQLQDMAHTLDGQKGKVMFKTPDGKHTASSPNELIEKIMNDPEYNIEPKNQDGLRRFFEELMKDDEDEPEGF